MKDKKKYLFDFSIGNPPYQTDQNGRTLPVYDKFMDEAYKVANITELITPARFLFNAGQTSKDWNNKMLEDPHFKVLDYQSDSSTVFTNVDIKGGIVITIHDDNKDFGAIGTFVPSPIMRSVIAKIKTRKDFVSLTTIIFTSSKYALTNIYADHPEYSKYVKSEGKHSQIDTNAFGKMPIFKASAEEVPEDCRIKMYGRVDNHRAYYWVQKKYIVDSGNLHKYKIFVSAVNGSGDFGITLSNPVIGEPNTGATQSFLGIGCFDNLDEAEHLMKFIKGKFARALLCTLKITHHNPPVTWANIPLQDFTSASDIDWSKSIHEIDLQLYRKYGLTAEEINFIETNVKEMA